jgi:hypothetical protein
MTANKVEPSFLDYIYSFGEEAGVRVGFINYPRFPREPAEIMANVESLAHDLMIGLSQGSYSIVTPAETFWVSRRP